MANELDEMVLRYSTAEESRIAVNSKLHGVQLNWQRLKTSPSVASQSGDHGFVATNVQLSQANEILLTNKKDVESLLATSKKLHAEIVSCDHKIIVARGADTRAASITHSNDEAALVIRRASEKAIAKYQNSPDFEDEGYKAIFQLALREIEYGNLATQKIDDLVKSVNALFEKLQPKKGSHLFIELLKAEIENLDVNKNFTFDKSGLVFNTAQIEDDTDNKISQQLDILLAERDDLHDSFQQLESGLKVSLEFYEKDCRVYVGSANAALKIVHDGIRKDLLAANTKAQDFSEVLLKFEEKVDALLAQIKMDPAAFSGKSREAFDAKLNEIRAALDAQLKKLFAIPKIAAKDSEVTDAKIIRQNFLNTKKIEREIDPEVVKSFTASMSTTLESFSNSVASEKKLQDLFTKLESGFLSRFTEDKKIREIQILFERSAQSSSNNMEKLEKVIDALATRKPGRSLFSESGPKIKATTIELFRMIDPNYDMKSGKTDIIKARLKEKPELITEALNNLNAPLIESPKKKSH